MHLWDKLRQNRTSQVLRRGVSVHDMLETRNKTELSKGNVASGQDRNGGETLAQRRAKDGVMWYCDCVVNWWRKMDKSGMKWL